MISVGGIEGPALYTKGVRIQLVVIPAEAGTHMRKGYRLTRELCQYGFSPARE